MGLEYNRPGTQWDLDTMGKEHNGLVHNGTSIQKARYTVGPGQNGTGTEWDRYTVGLGHKGLGQNGTGTQWNWDMGHNGTGIQQA